STVFSVTYPATTEIYTLSLHDALPIFVAESEGRIDGNTTSQDAVRRNAPADQFRFRFLASHTIEVDLALHPGRLALKISLDRQEDRKSTRLNSSHVKISYAVFCLKKKK